MKRKYSSTSTSNLYFSTVQQMYLVTFHHCITVNASCDPDVVSSLSHLHAAALSLDKLFMHLDNSWWGVYSIQSVCTYNKYINEQIWVTWSSSKRKQQSQQFFFKPHLVSELFGRLFPSCMLATAAAPIFTLRPHHRLTLRLTLPSLVVSFRRLKRSN